MPTTGVPSPTASSHAAAPGSPADGPAPTASTAAVAGSPADGSAPTASTAGPAEPTRPTAGPVKQTSPTTSATTGPADAGDAGRAGASPGRYLELEAFRGLAAAAVVVFHAFQFTESGGGQVLSGSSARPLLAALDGAVALFFALSGFVLFLPLARSILDRERMQSARGFLVRRAVRVLPLYLVAVTAVWAARNPVLPGEWLDLVEHLTFTQFLDQQRIFYTIGPAWSLAVEVWFYGLLAVLAPLLHRATAGLERRGRVAALLGTCTALVVASLAYKHWAYAIAQIPFDRWPYWFNPLARLDNLAFGMLLAVGAAIAGGRTLGRGWPWVLRVAGALVVVAAAVNRGAPWADAYVHVYIAAGCTLIFASSVVAPRGGAWERALSAKPLTLLGLWSYSLYLWHEPLLHRLADWGWVSPEPGAFARTVALLLPLSLAAAFASYWVIEQPASKLRLLFTAEGRRADLAIHSQLDTPPGAPPATRSLAPPATRSLAPPGSAAQPPAGAAEAAPRRSLEIR